MLFGVGNNDKPVSSYGDYIEEIRDKMQKAHNMVRDDLKTAATFPKREKDRYDVREVHQPYQTGSYMWLRVDISQLSITPKLRKPDYLVLERAGSV